MTLADIFGKNIRKPSKQLAQIERTIEVGAVILLNDGRIGILTDIYESVGEKYGYVEGGFFTAAVTENEIFAYRNVAQ